MTNEERIRHVMSGLRLKTDEVGRPPSHDEVEAAMRKVISETEVEAMHTVHALDGAGPVIEQLKHLFVEITVDLRHRYEKLPGLKSMHLEFGYEGQLYGYGFGGEGYSQDVRAAQRAEVVKKLKELDAEDTQP